MKRINKNLLNFIIEMRILILITIFSGIFYSNSVYSQPLQLGQSVVTSYTPDVTDYVVRIADIRNRPPFIVGGNYWGNVPIIKPVLPIGADWTKRRMRNVYGIALDNTSPNPNIFIASSSVNCNSPDGNDSALIYKIDKSTFYVTTYVLRSFSSGPPQRNVNWMPNTGPRIGNICYDNFHNQLFATNEEDGRIYSIRDNGSGNGVVHDYFDPFLPNDDGSSGFAPLGERLWGIGAYGNDGSNVKIYFSVWVSDVSRHNGQNKIYSISLDNNGEFILNSVHLEISLPLNGNNYSNPVADIEFAFDGTMLLGERTMYGDAGQCDQFGQYAHDSRILEFPRNALGFYDDLIYQARNIGMLGANKNSTGGVDYGYGNYDSISNSNSFCDSIVIGTGDYLFSPPLVYGLQITDRNRGAVNYNDYSHFVDVNSSFITYDKTTPGDVDVFRKDLCSSPIDTNCISLVSDTTYCDSTGTYIYEFIVHNNSPTKTVEQLEITVDSPKPPNYVVTMPSTLNVTIPPSGTSATQRVKLVGPGAIARAEVCYTLSAQYVNDDCPWCCYIENCIKLPDCGACVEVISDSLYCSNNNYFYNFLLENGTIYNVTKIQLTSPGSDPITFVPQIIHFATPIAPGQIFPSEKVQILGGYAGLTVPIRIKLFSDDFECCYIELSHTFPACDTLKTGINGNELNIEEYKLAQNYPNPFNPTTNISFSVPEESYVELSIFDISGRLVQNIINNVKYVQGVYSVKFDGSNLPSGMYYYRLKTKDYIETRKMVLMK